MPTLPEIKRWPGNPILSTRDNYWEAVQVRNPAAYRDNGKTWLLYTASGEMEVKQEIRLGLAVSEDGYHFERVSDEPIVDVSAEGFDAGSVEDARIAKFDDTYYITYAARAYPYKWFADGNRPDRFPGEAPVWTQNLRRPALLTSKDLRHFKRMGPFGSDDLFDANIILFPEKINGRYVMLHRPTPYMAGRAQCLSRPMEERPGIWIAWSDDMLHWDTDQPLMKGQADWEAMKIGGSAPPIRTAEGWLTFYHGVSEDYVYRVGLMLLDLADPRKIIARVPHFIMEPEEEYEKKGTVANVIFPCGNVVMGDDVFIYYGGADTVCSLATARLDDLVNYVLEFRLSI